MALGPKNKNRYLASKPLKFKNKTDKPLLFPLHPDKVNRKPQRKSINSDINIRPLLLLAAIILVILGIAYLAFSQQALAVMVDGEPVGYIKDINTTEEELNTLILAKLKQDVGNNIEINEKITLQKVNSIFKKVSNNAEGVLANVCNVVSYNQEATKIMVEGKQAVIVSNIDTAKEVLKQVLANYKIPAGTSDPEFATQIKTEPTFVESTDVADTDTAVKLLSQTKQVEKVHTVVQGDTFASIANNAGMTEAELLKVNPSITNETKANLSIGQQLKVIMTVPTLQIRTFKTETKTVDIPYETKREYDDSMASGESEEIQEGVNGKKEVTSKIPYLNGIQQGTATTSEKVITPATPRILKIGTYEPDYDDNDYDDDSSDDE